MCPKGGPTSSGPRWSPRPRARPFSALARRSLAAGAPAPDDRDPRPWGGGIVGGRSVDGIAAGPSPGRSGAPGPLHLKPPPYGPPRTPKATRGGGDVKEPQNPEVVSTEE
ncbi:hypothetical protein ACHAXT_007952 [Thalassiosira profunda]